MSAIHKLLASTVLVAALIGAIATPSVPAQGNKIEKKEITTGKEPATGAAVIEIKEGKDEKYRFFVRNAEGHLLAMSAPTGFATEADAEKALTELRQVIAHAKVVRKDAAK